MLKYKTQTVYMHLRTTFPTLRNDEADSTENVEDWKTNKQ